MSHLDPFAENIENFERYGIYTYKFDPVGNLIFNSSSLDFSQVYLALPLHNIIYNPVKLDSFYNPNFTEFLPTIPSTASVVSVDDLQQQLDTISQENATLTDQLNSLISQSEISSSAADTLATKQVIIELRRLLGQGRVESDFSDTFPYTPIKKTTT
jgi:hypothetical protein